MRSGGGSVSMAADGHHRGVSVLDIIASWMRLMVDSTRGTREKGR